MTALSLLKMTSTLLTDVFVHYNIESEITLFIEKDILQHWTHVQFFN